MTPPRQPGDAGQERRVEEMVQKFKSALDDHSLRLNDRFDILTICAEVALAELDAERERCIKTAKEWLESSTKGYPGEWPKVTLEEAIRSTGRTSQGGPGNG